MQWDPFSFVSDRRKAAESPGVLTEVSGIHCHRNLTSHYQSSLSSQSLYFRRTRILERLLVIYFLHTTFHVWNHRITEWLAFGGTLKPTNPNPCRGLAAPHQLRLPRAPSNPALSASRDGTPTALWAAVPGPHCPVRENAPQHLIHISPLLV